MSRSRLLLPLTAAGAALLAVTLVLVRDRPPPLPGTLFPDEAGAAVARAVGSGLAAAARRDPGAPPASLAGTVPPTVRADADGRLVIEPALRDLFEYFLGTLGEEDLDAIAARLARHLQATLPPEAAARAWAVFGDYVGYRAALATGPADPLASLDDAGARLSTLQTLRRSHLGPEVADAFFAAEESYDRFTLDRLALERDSSLSAGERARRVAALEADLPPELVAARRDSLGISTTEAAVSALRADGGSEAEVLALREQSLGPEAAARLAALDREEAAWDARYADYRRQRAALDAAEGLADDERAAQHRALRGRLFSDTEIQRVDALDRIEAGTAH